MCGFIGEVGDKLLSEVSFKELLDLSIARGPDQQGVWLEKPCQLGFNRLSILDTSLAGKQPILSPSGRYTLVFNGEIYNYKELQASFNIDDNTLRSESDSEIIAHLLERVTINELAKLLNGMFAIAIWDRTLLQLHLIRDFAGIKPLYYGVKDDNFLFASQFNQIFKHPLFINRELCPDGMKSFMALGYMHPPETVFKNIHQVNPGEIIVWDSIQNKIVSQSFYYNWKDNGVLSDTATATKDLFKCKMKSVIGRQLRADVPIASFLSSGVDSTLVTSFAKQQKNDIKAYTFGVVGLSEFDERPKAATYAEVLGVEHMGTSINKNQMVLAIDDHFKAMPEPFGDYSSVPTYLVTKEAKKFATVMLSGDGGDELFYGYRRFYRSISHANWFNLPLKVRKVLVPFARQFNKKLSYDLQQVERFADWILKRQTHYRNIDNLMPNASFSKGVYETYKYKGKLNKKIVSEYVKKNEFYAHMQRILKKVDMCSMAHSLEVRVPFLDKDIIEYSNSIDSKYGLKHTVTKSILKSTLYDFIPEQIVSKDKLGFSVPLKDWLQNDLKEDFIETVLNTSFFGSEYVNMTVLKTDIDNFYKNTPTVNHWGLWHIYAWQKWALSEGLIEN